MSRRQLGKVLGAAGLSLAVMPIGGRASRAAEQAVYFTWSGYDVPEFFPAYVAKHGANPNMPVFADEEEALQKLVAGFETDVIHPCNNSLTRWRDAGVIQGIETSRLSNWGDVFADLKKIDGAQHDGQQFFIPVDWGNTSVLYRPDLVDIQEESWTLMWDERYAGRLSVAASAEETVVVAAIVAGAKDPFNLSDEEIETIRALLIKQKPLVRFYWESNVDIEQGLASGELIASTGWNSSAVTLKSQGIPIKYMNPKEGILTYCCGLVLSASAKNLDQSYDLMDAMIAPEAGKWLIEANGYGHSNAKSFDLVDPKTLEELNLPADPIAFLNNGIVYKTMQRLDVVSQMFESVKAAI